MVFEIQWGSGLLSTIIGILVTALFIHFAAKMVIDRASYLVSILVAIIGSLLGAFVWGLIGGIVGLLVAVATWALVAALFFRTRWTKGLIIGVVAWLLWFLVSLLISFLFERFG